MNCFSIYSIVWTIVIVLYDLKWSDYCEPLNIHLRIFIYFSIIVSLLCSIIVNDKCRFKRLQTNITIGNSGTIIICLIQLFEYLYCREIPLLSVILHGGKYSDFGGIPTIHVVIYTFAAFYAQVLFYSFLNTHKSRYLINYFIVIFTVYILQFMRGGLTICVSISALMFLSTLRNKINTKHIIIIVLSILCGLYLFGGIGNIRHGYSWDDSSSFFRFGRINNNFPNWIPSQFAWAYTYIVGSLATLNHNISINNCSPDLLGFIQGIIPDFICKRIWPGFSSAKPDLMYKAFTTTTGYFDSYYFGGIFGIYAMFLIVVIIALFAVYSRFIKERYRVIILANLSVVFALYFFTNGLHNSAVSFSIVYPILLSLDFIRIKIPMCKLIYYRIRWRIK